MSARCSFPEHHRAVRRLSAGHPRADRRARWTGTISSRARRAGVHVSHRRLRTARAGRSRAGPDDRRSRTSRRGRRSARRVVCSVRLGVAGPAGAAGAAAARCAARVRRAPPRASARASACRSPICCRRSPSCAPARQHHRRGGAERAPGRCRRICRSSGRRPSTPVPAAASATACRPRSASRWRGRQQRVIALFGDGSAMYSIQALWTAAQLQAADRVRDREERRYAALQEFAPVFGYGPRADCRAPSCPDLDFVVARGRAGREGRARRKCRRVARRAGRSAAGRRTEAGGDRSGLRAEQRRTFVMRNLVRSVAFVLAVCGEPAADGAGLAEQAAQGGRQLPARRRGRSARACDRCAAAGGARPAGGDREPRRLGRQPRRRCGRRSRRRTATRC